MASITFPSYLEFQSSGYSIEPTSNVHRSTMEDGKIKQARRNQKQRVIRSVQYLATAAEFESFKTWYKNDSFFGAKYFNWTDPVEDTTKDARMVDGLYQATPLNTRMHYYYITLKLETYE